MSKDPKDRKIAALAEENHRLMDKLDEMHVQIQNFEANHGANGGHGGNGGGGGGSHPDDVDEIVRLREENVQVRVCLYYISSVATYWYVHDVLTTP